MTDSEGEISDCEENQSSAVETSSTNVYGKELGKDSPNSPWLSVDLSRSNKSRTTMKGRDAESKEGGGVARLRLGPPPSLSPSV